MEVSSWQKPGYVLLKSTGTIRNAEDWRALTREFYHQAKKLNSRKLVLDQTEIEAPESLFDMAKVVDHYQDDLPPDIRLYRVGVVNNPANEAMAEFWEAYCRNRGYDFRIFQSLEDAVAFVTS